MSGFSLDLLVTASMTLFFVVDPIGIMPIFAALTQGRGFWNRAWVAFQGVLVAGGILAVFALVGQAVLTRIGITMAAFQAAGGVLLFLIGLEMVFEKRTVRRFRSAERSVSDQEIEHPGSDDIAIFPIGIPLLAGPGAIATMMLLMEANRDQLGASATVFLAMAVILAITFVAMLLAGLVADRVGEGVTVLVTRIMGMMLAALSVQFIFNGIQAAFGTMNVAAFFGG